MEDGFQLETARIAIVGLGLMGGSLALALRGKCARLFAIDIDRTTLELALANRVVDQADSDPARLLPQADLVVLATPVPVIIDYLHRLPSFIQKPCIVLDFGSTKRDILDAMAALPERFDPVGGHPICGKEKLGLENASPDLYQGALFVVTTLERTSARAKSAAEQIIAAFGARRLEMTAEEHDQALASTSHLPFVLSSALAHSTPRDLAAFVGSGFRSTSRLAGTPSHMMMGVLRSNRENILDALQAFCDSLGEIRSALESENYTRLEVLLDRSRAAYQALTDR